MKVKPLNDRLLVVRVEEEQKTKGGIIIPDTAKEKPIEAKVVAVGTEIEQRRLGLPAVEREQVALGLGGERVGRHRRRARLVDAGQRQTLGLADVPRDAHVLVVVRAIDEQRRPRPVAQQHRQHQPRVEAAGKRQPDPVAEVGCQRRSSR